uniref:Uncharacterized protein n=1 Tax=Glossina pallidipes TaxID=7398 RepID=A0A1B0AF70_GLOPL
MGAMTFSPCRILILYPPTPITIWYGGKTWDAVKKPNAYFLSLLTFVSASFHMRSVEIKEDQMISLRESLVGIVSTWMITTPEQILFPCFANLVCNKSSLNDLTLVEFLEGFN